MSWTVVVAIDQDKQDVGIATATWNKGQNDEFAFTPDRRGSEADIPEFVQAAQDALAAERDRRARELAYAAQIEALLNS